MIFIKSAYYRCNISFNLNNQTSFYYILYLFFVYPKISYLFVLKFISCMAGIEEHCNIITSPEENGQGRENFG